MTRGLTITKQVHFRQDAAPEGHARRSGRSRQGSSAACPAFRRLMALAIHMEDLVDRGEVTDYAELARLAHVTRARMTQIMNLLHLAPDIQEEILFLPAGRRRPCHGRRAHGSPHRCHR